MADINDYQQHAEIIAGGQAPARVHQEHAEVVAGGQAPARIFQQHVEVVTTTPFPPPATPLTPTAICWKQYRYGDPPPSDWAQPAFDVRGKGWFASDVATSHGWRGKWNTASYQNDATYKNLLDKPNAFSRQVILVARALVIPNGTLQNPTTVTMSVNVTVDDGIIIYWNGVEVGYGELLEGAHMGINGGGKVISWSATVGEVGVLGIYAENTFTGGLSRYFRNCATGGSTVSTGGFCDGTDEQNPFYARVFNLTNGAYVATPCSQGGWTLGKQGMGAW